jgi:integrase/recombinase XerD
MKQSNGLLYFYQDRRAQNLAKRTIEWYKEELNKWVEFCKTDIEIESITSQMIREYLFALAESGHNQGGIHGYYRALKVFLNWYDMEFEPENWKNPIRKVKAPKVINEPLQGVTIETAQQLINACDKSSFMGSRDSTICALLIETGLRANELLQLNVEDISFEDSSILVRKGKGRKSRSVFMGQSVRRQLRRYLKHLPEDGALFNTVTGTRLKYSGLRQLMRRLSIKAGLEKPPQIHDFRRGYCIQSLRNGIDLVTLSRLMGHSNGNLQVLTRYLKQTKTDLGNGYKSIIDS